MTTDSFSLRPQSDRSRATAVIFLTLLVVGLLIAGLRFASEGDLGRASEGLIPTDPIAMGNFAA